MGMEALVIGEVVIEGMSCARDVDLSRRLLDHYRRVASQRRQAVPCL